SGELACAGVDRLVHRPKAQPVTAAAYLLFRGAAELRDLRVREAVLLCRSEHVRAQLRGRAHVLGHLVDEDDLVEEPRVDRGGVIGLRDRRALAERLLQNDDTAVGRRLRDLQELLDAAPLLAPVEAGAALLERPERLLQSGGVVASDRHRLADRLHGGRQGGVGGRELLEGEARDLHHDVVERGLEARRRHPCDVVRDLVEAVPERQFRSELRDREAGGFGGQRRGAGDARIHLDDDDASVLGIHGELDVAAARVHADRPDDVDADVAEVLVLAVGQRECRRDRDRVAGVHADRVDVLDRADHDRVVGCVAHELELVLLPAEDRLFEEHLVRRRVVKAGTGDAAEVGLVERESGPESAHREARSDDQRVTELLRRGQALVHRVRDAGGRDVRTGLDHQLLEDLPVLALADRVDLRSDELDAVLLQDSAFVQRHRGVESGLTAERRQDRVRLLLRDDRLDHLGRDRLDVGGVGKVRIGHDRRRVGVHQDDPHALLTEHAAGLGSGIVELAGLADDDRAGPDDEDGADVVALGHYWASFRARWATTTSRKRSKR
ncbi:hypothetical protein ABE10_03795, partial [Bacillus toyonensis]|nr:hypothetical protein [Bacillus toyonensis]